MVKISDYPEFQGINADGKRIVKVSLIADTKSEVIALGTSGAGVEGLSSTEVMAVGSSAFTINSEFGQLGSNGWVF